MALNPKMMGIWAIVMGIWEVQVVLSHMGPIRSELFKHFDAYLNPKTMQNNCPFGLYLRISYSCGPGRPQAQ